MAHLAISSVDRDEWNATGGLCFPFNYERVKIIFITLVGVVTGKRADGTEVNKGGQNEVLPVYAEKRDGRGVYHDLDERAWNLYHENGDDYKEYP